MRGFLLVPLAIVIAVLSAAAGKMSTLLAGAPLKYPELVLWAGAVTLDPRAPAGPATISKPIVVVLD